MIKLKRTIEQYGRWTTYSMYVDRIEAHIDSDYSICVENSKSLIEGISKQICKDKNVEIAKDEAFHKLVKKAFLAIGYPLSEHMNVISSSLSAIAQQLGTLRTALGSTSHGKTIDELNSRNESLDLMAKEFLIDTVEIITCFLIRNFENENPRQIRENENENLTYLDNQEFNEFWDDSFGEFEMGDYSYAASEILYNVDNAAYLNECNNFIVDDNQD